MKDYLERFTDRQRRVAGNEFIFENRVQAALLLCGLLDVYDVLINGLEQNEEKLSLARAKTRLITEENKIYFRDAKQEEITKII